ncbi:MAG: hypothetical protein RIS29_2300 [Bacteroidota bacterium]|jgi:hypothetical protein
MSKTRKTRCWSCQSLDVIRWGKQLGKQRSSARIVDCFLPGVIHGLAIKIALYDFVK